MNLSPAAFKYGLLSLSARLAIALRVVERYFAAKGLTGPPFNVFLNHLWEVPVTDSFPKWEGQYNDLLAFGLGDPLPPEMVPMLRDAGVSEELFRRLIGNTIEIVYGSLYAASDNSGSLRQLSDVLLMCQAAGISPPPLRWFATSRFTQRQGWGKKLSPQQRDEWRFTDYDFSSPQPWWKFW